MGPFLVIDRQGQAMQISVAKQFNSAPAGRHSTDGPFSGEQFRRRLLEPVLRKAEPLIVDLDGTEGYGSSFLEEAFGGLIREAGLSYEKIRKLLMLKSEDNSLIEEIWEYIEDAESVRKSERRA